MAAYFDERVCALEKPIEREMGEADAGQFLTLLRKYESLFARLPTPE
ncbi:MAG: hypothetical protein ACJAUG_001139 [Halioglobus sp.]|jgi:hypothetical protein